MKEALPLHKQLAMEQSFRQIDECSDIVSLKVLAKMLVENIYYKELVFGEMIKEKWGLK